MEKSIKKKAILTLCRVFPAKHSRAGEPTGFEQKLKSGEKIHTIRSNAKNVWEMRCKGIASGDKYLSVREWTGRPYGSEQREFARYEQIGLQYIKITNKSNVQECWVDGKKVSISEIAKNDGVSVDDFVEWFLNGKDVFDGVIIHFTSFRY